MFSAILGKFIINAHVQTLETTLIVMYNDYNSFKIICDPGGEFIINPMLIYGVELGDAVIVTFENNVVSSIQKARKHVFCGFIESISAPTDDDLDKTYYYELHPKVNVRGQINIPTGTKLIIPKKIYDKKIIVPKKPILLEYTKGPCKNYYEVL